MNSSITRPFKRTTTRTILSVMMFFLVMLIIFFYLSKNYHTNLIEMRKHELQRQVEISINTIEPILFQLRNNNIEKEEALAEVVKLLRRMTYTSETMRNYIFMSSYEGIMLVQPLEPWMQDTYQLDLQDSYGRYFIHDLISTAQSPSGDGFVSYFYPPPGADTPGEKLSYVKGIPELGCYIGTGMFYEDIDNLFKEYLIGPLLIMVLGLTAVYVLIIIYMSPLLKCFHTLLNIFHRISQDPDTAPDVPVESFPIDSDEHEILSGFKSMIMTLVNSRKELKNSEQRYRYLYEESFGVRIIVDRNGIILDINKSFLRTTGLTETQFAGKRLQEIFISKHKQKVKSMIESAFNGEYKEALDFDLPDALGKIRTILISDVIKVPEDNSKILMTGVDITNRKIAEQKAEIQKEQLIQADKFASLGVLVSGVAHEINNPNQFILSNAGLMNDVWNDFKPVIDEYAKDSGDFYIQGMKYSEIKDYIPEYLERINEGARRIDKIVSGLKTLSRNDSDKAWSEVDINSVLEAAIDLCSNMLRKATDNLSTYFTPELPPVYGNAQQLEQVFINLIQNASQALNDKSDEIRIETSLYEENSIRISFKDQGCGIDPENLKKVFDPFYTTKREIGGTGIGLSISKSIIDEHKGLLSYFSTPGVGTTAEVILKSAALEPIDNTKDLI